MFHSISSFIYVFVLVLTTVYVSSHSNVMLLISCHAIYIFMSLILCFMPANTLEVDTEKKQYVLKGTITVRDSDLYLYDPNMATIMIQTESMSLTQTGPRYL